MSYLLDVNILLACGWRSHAKHQTVRAWLEAEPSFATTPITELGFLRVSLSPAYNASFADAQSALANIIRRKGAMKIPSDAEVAKLAEVASHADVTDAYLVALARAHSLKLATLDLNLTRKSWAAGIARDPISPTSPGEARQGPEVSEGI